MDTKASDGNNLNTFDDDHHSLNKIENKIKDTVFGIVFALLKEQEISVHFSTVLVVIQMFQTIAFVFHDTLAPAWNYTDITNVLYDIFDFFDLVPYIKDTNWNVYVAIMYLGIVAIFITLFLAFVVHYSFTRKKISFSGPVVMLRGIVRVFTTILFLPFINYFVSMLGCVSDETGTQVHAFFSEQQCWTGEHIIHVVFALLGAIIFAVLSLAVCVIFYEYKTNSNDAGAKASARPNLILNTYQLIMIVCLTFLTDTDFRAVLLILIFFGSGVVFLKFAYNPPAYDEFTIKLWSFLAAINFWGAVMAIFASILETTLFRGSVIVWLVGIPFVGFIHLASRDSRVGLLLININKFQNGAEIQNQIRYVTKLIKWRLSSKKAATLLDGYIGIHKQSCNEEDCPLRQKLLKNNRLIKTLMSQDETLNEKLALLIQLLNKIYSDGLKRFPNDTSLRISYAFFLLEKMHNKQQALQELTQAEQSKPTFDEQFIIYRYKKLVEDEIAESQNEGGGLDVVTEVTFQNHLYHLQANIEKSALLHMEFWSQLSDGNPDLAKLNDIGSKINSSVQYVEDYWVKLLKINSNNAKSMKLYGKYLIEIINDKAAGETFIEKARVIANEANKKALVAGGGEGDGFSSDITPTVWISGEQEKFGIITTLNLSAASLFGYSKTELLNQKVDVMMPQIYARYHDSFLENYINNGEPSIIGKNKDKLVFGKTKSGYIFPVYMNIKANQSIIEGIQFIATFRTEKNFKNVAYVLTNLDGSIDSISASCINILKIDQKTVNLKKSNVQDYMPNVIQDRTVLFQSNNASTRAQATLTVNYPKDSEYLIEDEALTAQVHCQCTEVAFLTGKQNVGYQFRLERVYEKPPVVIGQLEGRAKISNFQFKCEKDRPFIVGEYVGDLASEEADVRTPDDDLLGLSSRVDNSNIASFVSDMKAKKEEEESEVQRINYGIGIKTLRLVDGKPQEIEDLKSEGSESDDEEGTGNSVLQQKNAKSSKNINKEEQQLVTEDLQEDGSYRDFSNTFKSRKALSTVVGDRSLPSTIKNLKIIANGLCIVLIAIAITDYIIARNDLDDIKQDVDMFDYSNQYLYEMMNAVAKTQDLYLLNIGVLTGIYTEADIRSMLTTSLNTAKSLKVTLDQSISSLSADHQALLNNPSINLMSIDGTNTTKGLTQATEEVISRAFTLLTKNLSDIMPNQSDYYYLTTNLFNDYYVGLKTSANMYAIEMSSKAGNKNTTFLLLLIGSILALFVALLMCFPILIQVNRSKEEVLTLFLDIPERTVKGLYTKCEVFLSNLQIGEEDEIMSEIDADDLDKTQGGGDHESAKELVPRKKRKHFKNSVQNQKSFFIQFFVIAALVEAYFLFNYITSVNLLNHFQQLAIEVNETSVALPFYAFTFAADKQLYINSSFPMLGLTSTNSTYNLAVNLVKIQYVLDGTILEQHSIDRNIHTDTYIEKFNQMMMGDPCNSFVTITVDNTDCETFADSTISQGMSVAITRHFENLRSMLTCYASSNLGNTCSITLPTMTISGMTTLQNTQLSMLASTKAIESYKLLYTYIKGCLETLMVDFKACIDDQFSSNLTRRLIIFIVFVILVGVVYAFLWLALVNKISNDVWRTRSMLSMIPLNVIARIKSIRLYLKKFWNQRNVDEN